jgi:crossover junction endodeoxyribonuclease RuvC
MPQTKTTTILGIDPGYAITGYAIVDIINNQISARTYGVIQTSAKEHFPDRLLFLKKNLEKIIIKYSPQELAIENIFFSNNAKTAIHVGEARGVILITAMEKKIHITNYTPLQIKQAVTGHGRADKKQIQKMIQIIFSLKEIPQPDDAADALAVAYCGAHDFNTYNAWRYA